MLTHKQKSEAFGLKQGWEVIKQLGALELLPQVRVRVEG